MIDIYERDRHGQRTLFAKISFNENLTRAQGVQLLVFGRQKANQNVILVRVEFSHRGETLLAQATMPEEGINLVSKLIPIFFSA